MHRASVQFRTKDGEYEWFRCELYAFVNPASEEIEYIVCTNVSHKYVKRNFSVYFLYFLYVVFI